MSASNYLLTACSEGILHLSLLECLLKASGQFCWLPEVLIVPLQRYLLSVSGDEGEAAFFSLVAMIVGTFVILILAKCRQYLIILVLYLLTFWPFLIILIHFWNCESGAEFPLPLDLCPFW